MSFDLDFLSVAMPVGVAIVAVVATMVATVGARPTRRRMTVRRAVVHLARGR